jgi:hypothetical protein
VAVESDGSTGERRFPCLDGHRYSACIGPEQCWAERCWNGRRLRLAGGRMRADVFDRPLRVVRYTASDCANCVHAVDLETEQALLSCGGRAIKRWTNCELGLWAGPASLYNLLNHRVPVKRVGHCPAFTERSRDQMRPELAAKREGDRARSRARRAALRSAKRAAQADRQPAATRRPAERAAAAGQRPARSAH